MNSNSVVRRSAAVLALSCVSAMWMQPAAAVEPLDTFSVRVGSFANRFNTTVRVDGELSDGTTIDLGNDLGLDNDNTIGLIGLTWRPFDHHEFGFAYYRDDVSGEKTLTRDIVFDDVTYEANARIGAERKFDIYELSYIWWAADHEKWAMGPRLGVVWYKTTLGIDLQVDANGNAAGASFDRSVSGDLPAPAIGGGWRYTPSENWRLSADVGFFKANINDVDANVTYGRFGVEWYPWEHFGFWSDITANKVSAELKKNSFNGDMDFRQEGIRIGATYRF